MTKHLIPKTLTYQQETTPSRLEIQRSHKVSKIPTLINSYNNVNISPISQVGSSFVRTRYVAKNSKLKNSTANLSQHQKQKQHQNAELTSFTSTKQQENNSSKVLSSRNAFHFNKQVRHRSTAVTEHHQQNHKMNLCGYDSFLHATICSVGLNHSVHAQTAVGSNSGNLTTAENFNQQSPVIASMPQNVTSSITNCQKTYLKYWHPLSNNSNDSKNASQNKTNNETNKESRVSSHNNLNTSIISQNLPRHFGYQRLHSSTKHNLAALNLVSPSIKRTQHNQLEKWHKEHIKNYDQMLCAKLSKKLQQTKLNDKSIENGGSNRKYRLMNGNITRKLLKNPKLGIPVDTDNNEVHTTIHKNKVHIPEDSDATAGISINGDPIECENLLGQSSEDEDIQQEDYFNDSNIAKKIINDNDNVNRFVSFSKQIPEATLIDFSDFSNDILKITENQSSLQSTELHKICDNENENISSNSNINVGQNKRTREFELMKVGIKANDEIDKNRDSIVDQIDNFNENPETVIVEDDEEAEIEEDEKEVRVGVGEEEGEVNEHDKDPQPFDSERLEKNIIKDGISNPGNRDNTASATMVTANMPNFNDSSSALVHRYVHEHIHHHYHHFEETDQ